jgi:hypothetical protein
MPDTQFGDAQVEVDGCFKGVAPAHDAAVFRLPHHVSIVRVDLVDGDAGPGIVNRTADARTAVNRNDHGILLAGFESRRFDEAAVERVAVGARELHNLGRKNVEFIGLSAIGLMVDAEFGAIA